ncbi:G-type lectin S-receptor-like serine/threonine-protein kinase [Melia azedarach]|uniref:G-type lectin S-receptor-like serine/threonine-protein kinase n=1 Tax=Melia azedarach TaxID=155640 RepID=A0ACC1Y429_MELAZ|nr:G-type lectin S-receptor-like serine/threonine-protein kinase [Melia azedarach]
MSPSYSKTDKLLQGQLLKDGMELVSAFGNFRLGFFSPRDTTNRYLGIYYQKNIDRTGWYTYDFLSTIQIGWSDFSDFRTNNPFMWPRKHGQKKNLLPVWVANRNTPILDKSGILTIDSDGSLKILHAGGNPIVISSVQPEVNTSATLLKNGNFVLYEMNADGSERRMLWQSFDYPTDVLLPEMKLGINLQTGQQWFIRSWNIYTSPAEGSYTLGMDPNISNKLIIWKNAEVQWTSSLLPNNSIRFFSAGPSYYNFSYTSDERERYLTYSADEDAVSFPLIKILPIGGLIDDTGRSIRCITFGGCGEYRYLPSCWRRNVDIQVKYGYMDGPGFKFPESDNMTLNNCRSECLRNCSCIAYTTTNKYANTGCQIWSRGIKFMESYSDELAGKIYLLVEPNGKSASILEL